MRLGVIPQKYHMAILQDNALQRSGLHLAENARSVVQSNCWRMLGDHRRAARNPGDSIEHDEETISGRLKRLCRNIQTLIGRGAPHACPNVFES
jgi:hypothetical protein